MHPARRLACLTLAVLIAACSSGGDDGTGPDDDNNAGVGGDGGVSMSINGSAWRSAKSGDHATLSNRTLSISTVGTAGGVHALILTVGSAALGTFSLDYGQPGNAIISDPSSGWGTAFPGGTGSITITALNATHAAGTFSFDAKPGTSSASGTVSVRNGVFDIPF